MLLTYYYISMLLSIVENEAVKSPTIILLFSVFSLNLSIIAL